MMRIFNTVIIAISILSIVGCANNPIRDYKAETDIAIRDVQIGQLNPAIMEFKARQNDLMSQLELGSLYRLAPDYVNSNLSLGYADNYITAWLASFRNGSSGSLISTVEGGLINDKTVDYQVKDYEKVMIASYRALNNIDLNRWQDARIEIKRMFEIEDRIQQYRAAQFAKASQTKASSTTSSSVPSFNQFETKYSNKYDFTTINSPGVLKLKNSYENAFSHYLAGFVFEALGEYSLARPGYLRALELNPGSALIKQSIANLDNNIVVNNNSTDLLIVEELGHAPQLNSISIEIPYPMINNNLCISLLRIALPELVTDAVDTWPSDIYIDNHAYRPTLFTDVNLMAARYLHDSLPNLYTSAAIRAARDITLQAVACNNGGQLASLAATIFGQIVNGADERTWTMLPGKIYLDRVTLSRGTHAINVTTIYNQTFRVNIDLTKPYQVLTLRVIGNRVYFSLPQ